MCHTRWISRIDGLDVFEETFTYVVETVEYFSMSPESTINRDTSIKAQAFFHLFHFISKKGTSIDLKKKR